MTERLWEVVCKAARGFMRQIEFNGKGVDDLGLDYGFAEGPRSVSWLLWQYHCVYDMNDAVRAFYIGLHDLCIVYHDGFPLYLNSQTLAI